MSLTPEQSQLLQYYMQKNRSTMAPMAQAPQLPDTGGGGGGPGLASILSTVGGFMDKTAPMSGPLQPGQSRPTVMLQQSGLSKFADQLDPQAAMMRKYMASSGMPGMQGSSPMKTIQALLKMGGMVGF